MFGKKPRAPIKGARGCGDGACVILGSDGHHPPLLIVALEVAPLVDLGAIGGAASADVGHLAAVNGGELEAAIAGEGRKNPRVPKRNAGPMGTVTAGLWGDR